MRIHKQKRDASEADIVKALRDMGASVTLLDTPVDLLIGFRKRTFLAEVKTPGTQYGKKLNKNQQAFADSWRGGNVLTLWAPDDAVRLINLLSEAA